MVMFWVDLISWWYGKGFSALGSRYSEIFVQTADFFSVSDLLSSLFKPFRQTLTSANYQRTLGQKLSDAFISRSIGFVTRLFIILVGVALFILEGIAMIASYILWPFVPVAPLILVALTLTNFGF